MFDVSKTLAYVFRHPSRNDQFAPRWFVPRRLMIYHAVAVMFHIYVRALAAFSFEPLPLPSGPPIACTSFSELFSAPIWRYYRPTTFPHFVYCAGTLFHDPVLGKSRSPTTFIELARSQRVVIYQPTSIVIW